MGPCGLSCLLLSLGAVFSRLHRVVCLCLAPHQGRAMLRCVDGRDHVLVFHSPTDGHLGRFRSLAVMKNAAVNTRV